MKNKKVLNQNMEEIGKIKEVTNTHIIVRTILSKTNAIVWDVRLENAVITKDYVIVNK